MNKNQTLLFQDYLGDKSDLRLSIFVGSVNPGFKISKKVKEQLLLLISDYEKDLTNKNRLKLIFNFIEGNTVTSSNVKQKPVLKKVLNKREEVIEQELTPLQVEFKEIQARLDDLYNEIKLGEDRKEREKIAKELGSEIRNLEAQADSIGRQIYEESLETLDPVEEEKKLLISIFGDSEDKNSIAYRVLNDELNAFKIKTLYDPAIMLRRLFVFNRKEPITFSAGMVGSSSSTSGSTWLVRKGNFELTDQGMEKIS